MYTMKESVAVVKEADAKKGFSSTKSDNSIHRARNESEKQFGSLRGVIDSIRSDGGTPSVESIATELSGMHTAAQRAPALLALQQTHGNQYVQRVVTGVQAKLKVGQPGDIYEQEADRVAVNVVRQLNGSQSQCQTAQLGGSSEEKVAKLEKKPFTQQLPILPIQQPSTINNVAISPNLGQVIQRARGNGQALSEQVRDPLERSFGDDFSKVIIHADAESNRLNHLLHARAFTIGSDIFLRPAEYNLAGEKGLRLLCHELSHVVQQRRLGLGAGVVQLTPTDDFRSAIQLANEGQRAARLREIIRSLEVQDLSQAMSLAGALAGDTQLRTDFRRSLPTLHQDILSALSRHICELVDQQQTIFSRRRGGVRGPREGIPALQLSPALLARMEAMRARETSPERRTAAPHAAGARALAAERAEEERMRGERAAPARGEAERLEAARQAETALHAVAARALAAERAEEERMRGEHAAPARGEAERLEAVRQAEEAWQAQEARQAEAAARALAAERAEEERMRGEHAAPARGEAERLEAARQAEEAWQAQEARQAEAGARALAAERAEEERMRGERAAPARGETERLEAARQAETALHAVAARALAAERAEEERMRGERAAPARGETERLEAARQAETALHAVAARALAAERAEEERMRGERAAPARGEAERLEAVRQAEEAWQAQEAWQAEAGARALAAERVEEERMRGERTAPAIPLEWRMEAQSREARERSIASGEVQYRDLVDIIGERAALGLLSIGIVGGAVGAGIISGGVAWVILGAFVGRSWMNNYFERREEIERGGYDLPIRHTVITSLMDVLGLARAIEGITGVRIGTEEQLNGLERTAALGTGITDLALLAAGSRVFRQGRAVGRRIRTSVEVRRARLRAGAPESPPAPGAPSPPARPGGAPVTAARPPSEVTTLTNVQPEILSREVLPQYNLGSGFSGVYNPVTRQWVALASGESTSLVSGRPIGTVDQWGGHELAEVELVARTGITDVSRNVGFVIIREAVNTLRIRWNSLTINGRNFRQRAAPDEYQPAIREAVQRDTGFEVIE